MTQFKLTKFKVNSKGVQEFLQSQDVAKAVHDKAEEFESNLSLNFEPRRGVVVDDYTTDRAASSVTIRDVRGKNAETKQGALSRAASAAGLEVTRK